MAAADIPREKKVMYNFLGSSGLRVSNICLGCMTFGRNVTLGSPSQQDEDSSHQIMDRFVQWGGNFFDTADIYGPHFSEQIVGRWLERRERDNFVVATKCNFPVGVGRNRNSVGLSRRHMTASITGSLQRLHTNYVDIYQTHAWDAATNIEETLRTFDDLVRAEKVRYVGLCNVNGWQLQKIVDTTDRLGLNPVVSLQQQYSLVCRESELEPFQVCKANGIGVLPWSPLKGGLLTGKVKRGVKPSEGRLGYVANNISPHGRSFEVFPHYNNFTNKDFDVLETAQAIAEQKDKSVAQVAIRWLLQKDVTSSVIIGATSCAQLDDNMGAANGWSLSQSEMNNLDQVSSVAQFYPYSSINQANVHRNNPMARDYVVRSKV
ncbi:4-deoxy-L-erythro-5-hexoseulose uronic acid reductase [Elysia marginata]|uniref:4-deoxy-L-erythro-5-hexoseulose uronic acid reductase n=1 Tax=Elysia marginata TaxID=1093978 RepID=A0AAV4JQE9_9GAST|nr:4-deoxy-L-erythro-5-hexoseulose uronic acid reductase [Elysia marginata]